MLLSTRFKKLGAHLETITLEDFKDWNTNLAPWMGRVSAPVDIKAFISVLQRLGQCKSAQIIAFPQAGDPEVLVDTTPSTFPAANLNPRYVEGAYLLDPFYLLAMQERASGFFQLSQLAPPDFEQSEFYRSFYRRAEIVDEVCFLRSMHDGLAVISLSRVAGEQKFGSRALATLEAATPVTIGVLDIWWAQ